LAIQLARELSEKFECGYSAAEIGDVIPIDAIRIISMQRTDIGIGGVLIGEEIIVADTTKSGLSSDAKLIVIETGRSKPRKERRDHGDVLIVLGMHLGLQKHV
jgi:hypothetical protein